MFAGVSALAPIFSGKNITFRYNYFHCLKLGRIFLIPKAASASTPYTINLGNYTYFLLKDNTHPELNNSSSLFIPIQIVD
jgi:hypothetical protein